jgi:hypothetical protein
MTDESKPQKAEKPVENLELNRETLADLTEEQAERVEGGAVAGGTGRSHGELVSLIAPGYCC